MTALRHLLAARRRALLMFVLLALGMNALVPAGTMIVPSGEHGAAITLCPETHPLARSLGQATAPDMAALHAAMGHTMAPVDDPAPEPEPTGTAAPSQSCAFAGLALAGLLTEQSEAPSVSLPPLPEPPALHTRWRLVAPAHLRPPLRAPPRLI